MDEKTVKTINVISIGVAALVIGTPLAIATYFELKDRRASRNMTARIDRLRSDIRKTLNKVNQTHM